MTSVRQSFTNKPRFSAIPSQLAVAITAPAGFSAGFFYVCAADGVLDNFVFLFH